MLGLTLSIAALASAQGEAPALPMPTPTLPIAGPVEVAPSNVDRDPFRPFTLDLKPLRADPPKTPLEQYEIGTLKLVAVIYSTTNPRAMVEDASGLGYTIEVGTPIGRNGGVVTKIEPETIVIEEEFVDFYGDRKKSDVVLKLQTEGEKKP